MKRKLGVRLFVLVITGLISVACQEKARFPAVVHRFAPCELDEELFGAWQPGVVDITKKKGNAIEAVYRLLATSSLEENQKRKTLLTARYVDKPEDAWHSILVDGQRGEIIDLGPSSGQALTSDYVFIQRKVPYDSKEWPAYSVYDISRRRFIDSFSLTDHAGRLDFRGKVDSVSLDFVGGNSVKLSFGIEDLVLFEFLYDIPTKQLTVIKTSDMESFNRKN